MDAHEGVEIIKDNLMNNGKDLTPINPRLCDAKFRSNEEILALM